MFTNRIAGAVMVPSLVIQRRVVRLLKFRPVIPLEEELSTSVKPRLTVQPIVGIEILCNVCPDFKVRSALEVVEECLPVGPCHRREEV